MTTPATTPQTTPTAHASRGQFVWHDYMTPDVEKAKAFYGAVLGWDAQEWGDTGYQMWTVDGTPRGGYGPFDERMRAAKVPPHWITYITVPDVDAYAAEAKGMGATLAMTEDIPEVGRIAMMQDPQGAWFTLFKPIDTMGRTDAVPVGDVSWHEHWGTDTAAAYDFYTKLFGWESAGEFSDPAIGVYRMFGRNGLPLGGMATLMPEMQGVPPHWLPYFRVANLDEAIERVKANGGQLLSGPMEVPGGDHVAQCFDALGGAFALHETAG